jgi:hypothetical protein
MPRASGSKSGLSHTLTPRSSTSAPHSALTSAKPSGVSGATGVNGSLYAGVRPCNAATPGASPCVAVTVATPAERVHPYGPPRSRPRRVRCGAPTSARTDSDSPSGRGELRRGWSLALWSEARDETASLLWQLGRVYAKEEERPQRQATLGACVCFAQTTGAHTLPTDLHASCEVILQHAYSYIPAWWTQVRTPLSVTGRPKRILQTRAVVGGKENQRLSPGGGQGGGD